MRDERTQEITVIGMTNFRSERRCFGVKRSDRRHHMYLVGQTGTGKSTLLANLARQDIANGEGVAVLDPHGDLAEKLVSSIAPERAQDLIYLDATDTHLQLGFNPLQVTTSAQAPLVASGVISVLKKIWPEFWGPRMEYILRNVLLSLLELQGCTLLDIPRLLHDTDFRRHVANTVRNLEVRNFWFREYDRYPPHFRAEAIAPIQNKVGEFLVNPFIRRIIGQPESSFDLRTVMDERRILIVNLAKGRIGEDTAALLGAMLVTHIGLAGLSRAALPDAERRDFYVYVDEFPSFATDSFAGMVSEMRKYRVCLVLAHQYMSQLEEQARDAVLGNVGTKIAFRVGLPDALLLEKEFFPEFRATDLVNLPNYHMYLRLMIDGVVSRPFSATTLDGRASCGANSRDFLR